MMAGWAPLLNSLMSVPEAVSNILIKVPCNEVNNNIFFFLCFYIIDSRLCVALYYLLRGGS